MTKLVRQRDAEQCTYVDEHGRRCSEKRYLTIEHRIPFAKGGLPTPDNLCLLCQAHNHHTARQAFGEKHIERKRLERASMKASTSMKESASLKEGAVLAALCSLGFQRKQAAKAFASSPVRVEMFVGGSGERRAPSAGRSCATWSR